jgi:hypothetical protein
MNLTQNDRLKQVTADTLIVGVDIGSKTHFCRAFDWRGFQEKYSDSATLEWDSLHFCDGQRKS